ncbi:hypothetical protein E2986_13150 [Frieseomelitta varia]|uniref:Uncharacterized protein n=1 Tax=Frieseomelitta varia TaxID=561572 RepID=A0A833VZC3_9HYME|nr:hypothetical protein E2986_13150 [Frieseomelitta varia]
MKKINLIIIKFLTTFFIFLEVSDKTVIIMSDRPSNGEYKYQREETVDSKLNIVAKERDEKEHQVDKAGEYVRELLQEKVELDSQKWPNATRLIDQDAFSLRSH